MDTDLAIPEGKSLAPITDDDFNKLTAGGDFLPRIQMMAGSSGLVTEGKATVGHYMFIRTKEDVADLDVEFDALICAMRLKAMRIDDEVMSFYDASSDTFKKIWAESKIKDSGCLAGPEFLLYIPDQQSFATFYMASKSAARVAPTVRSYIDGGQPNPATFGASLVKTKKYSWHVPTVKDCSTPFTPPTQEDFIEQLDKFQNPEEADVEEVVDDAVGRAR